LPKTAQFGIITYINLEGNEIGKNTLKIIKKLKNDSFEWTIPFQYIPSD